MTSRAKLVLRSARGVFWFLQTSDGLSITAGVARRDHTFGLVKSGFANADAALAWVLANKTRSEFDRGLHTLSSEQAAHGFDA